MIERLATSFETARLALRLVEPRDLDGLWPVNADDDVTRFLPYETWRARDDADAWYARVRALHDAGRSRQLVVIARDEDRVVGGVTIFNVDEQNRRAEVGYVLGRRDRGRGLMREAVAAALARMFDDLDLRRVEAFADPRNAASHRLLLALGFAHEGTLRGRSVVKGVVVDSNAYGLLRDDFARG